MGTLSEFYCMFRCCCVAYSLLLFTLIVYLRYCPNCILTNEALAVVRCHVSLLHGNRLYKHYKCQNHIQHSRALASQASRISALTKEVKSGVGRLSGLCGGAVLPSVAHCMLGVTSVTYNYIYIYIYNTDMV